MVCEFVYVCNNEDYQNNISKIETFHRNLFFYGTIKLLTSEKQGMLLRILGVVKERYPTMLAENVKWMGEDKVWYHG